MVQIIIALQLQYQGQSSIHSYNHGHAYEVAPATMSRNIAGTVINISFHKSTENH